METQMEFAFKKAFESKKPEKKDSNAKARFADADFEVVKPTPKKKKK